LLEFPTFTQGANSGTAVVPGTVPRPVVIELSWPTWRSAVTLRIRIIVVPTCVSCE
jgi:hypothetical protein